MIAVQLATSELVIILIGGLVATYFASDPYKRRLVRAYRRHRKNLDSRSHIAYYADLLDAWDADRRNRPITEEDRRHAANVLAALREAREAQ